MATRFVLPPVAYAPGSLPTTSRYLALAQLVRLPNVFTAMADITLGALVTHSLPGRLVSYISLLIASSCFYMAGMVWNDFFDQEQDRKERPFRPLPSGKISPQAAAGLGIGLFVIGLVCVFPRDFGHDQALSWQSIVIALILICVILLYDAWIKRTWLGPVAMGACRFLNVLLGLSVAEAGIESWGIFLALSVGVYITGVTWFARTEAQVSRQAMLRAAAGVMLAGLLISLAVSALVDQSSGEASTSALFPYLLAGLGLYFALPVMRAINNPSPARVQAAVKRCVLGLIFFDAILATSVVGNVGLLLAVLIIPAIYLGRRLYST